MVHGGAPCPFYSRVQQLVGRSLKEPDAACEELRFRNPFFYHKCYVRFFLNYNTQELEDMSMQEFADCLAVVYELKKFWHLPFRDKE